MRDWDLMHEEGTTLSTMCNTLQLNRRWLGWKYKCVVYAGERRMASKAKTSNGLPSPSVLCAWVHLSCAQFTSGDDQETYSCDFCLTHVAS